MTVATVNTYYKLTKPGIIRGNAITAIAGFFLASQGDVDASLLVTTVGGLSLIVASACVVNNFIDRDIDSRMSRTKQRALASGVLSGRNALIYAAVLGCIGSMILLVFTNLLTTVIALFGFIAYVVLYGAAKRRTVHGTIIGSISGAVPPVVGYVSVTGQLDVAALLLFLIVVSWQMPHFYAIAIYRIKDYADAGLPVLPVVRGIGATKRHTLYYTVAFTILAPSLTVFGYTGKTYALVAVLLGLLWLYCSLKYDWPFNQTENTRDNPSLDSLDLSASRANKWARQMFLCSLIIISLLSVMIVIDSF